MYLGFFNQSKDTEFRLGKDFSTGIPTLVDERGNTFLYIENLSGLPDSLGLFLNNPSNFKNFGFTLPPNSANEMALVFEYKGDINVKELGEYFSVSLKYKLYNGKDNSISAYNVSFTEIKAQKPR